MLKNKIANFEKLRSFGFVESSDTYSYSTKIVDRQFTLTINISSAGNLTTKITDIDSDDEYVLHLIASAEGAFVGKVRMDYQNILQEITDKCFENDVFQSDYAHEIVSYIREKYQDELEFLWEKTPQAAIVRRKDNDKWYAVFLNVSQTKLGLNEDENIDMINLKFKTDELESLIDGKKYFRAYHMNKKHWLTMRLDGSISVKELCQRIDESYLLAKK